MLLQNMTLPHKIRLYRKKYSNKSTNFYTDINHCKGVTNI